MKAEQGVAAQMLHEKYSPRAEAGEEIRHDSCSQGSYGVPMASAVRIAVFGRCQAGSRWGSEELVTAYAYWGGKTGEHALKEHPFTFRRTVPESGANG
ncbi:hypothetical protein TDMWS_13060 [Thermodesulfomicrobium sp. WS]|nr:hypothetical protein TDMWS_13060 [Thermodesulfomicrobium sp. WS]